MGLGAAGSLEAGCEASLAWILAQNFPAVFVAADSLAGSKLVVKGVAALKQVCSLGLVS